MYEHHNGENDFDKALKRMTTKIAIIGAGEVGASTAFALLLSSVCAEILLVEKNVDKRDAQVRDLSNAARVGRGRTRVRGATYKEASQCDIIIVTAGSKKAAGAEKTAFRRWVDASMLTSAGHRSFVGETSLQVLYENAGTMRCIIEAMKPIRPDAILLIVTNPLDVLTTLVKSMSGLPDSQVIGSGTFVDSVRLKGFLADRSGVAASSIGAHVLGEHGNTQFVAWSSVTLGGVPLEEALPGEQLNKRELEDGCNFEGRFIMEAKGAIAYGISAVVCDLCASILYDERKVRTVSFYQTNLHCCLSMPAIIGRKGIEKPMAICLSSDETAMLQKAAQTVQNAVDGFSTALKGGTGWYGKGL